MKELDNVLKLLRSWSSIGVNDSMSDSIRRKIILTNQTALFLGLVSLPFFILFRRDLPLLAVCFAHGFACLGVVSLNKRGYVNRSRTLMSLAPVTAIFIMHTMLSINLEGTSPGVLLLSVIGIPLVLFHVNEWRFPVVSLIIMIVYYYSFDFIAQYTALENLSVSYARPWMYIVTSAVGIAYFLFAFVHLKLMNREYEVKLKVQLKKIETKTMLIALREERLQKMTEELLQNNTAIKKTNLELDEVNDQLKRTLKDIADKNKEITESIQYASTIQTAILPSIEEIKHGFPKSFVLYEPKDIVCGDFYYFDEDEDKMIFACVDCTGHGVPGALMTVIGYSQIHEIFNEMEKKDAKAILTELDERVRLILQQNGQQSHNQDGMELALIIYDKKRQELEFSGANRPLYMFKGDEFYKYESSKDPIGGSQIEDKIYSKQLIPVEPGERIYLFSDGYCDQFGGPEGKKYKNKKFVQKLKDMQNLSIDKHEQILRQELMDWKGVEEQVDDILIIGIEF